MAGLNVCNGPVFTLQFESESLILQGPNGSGKSSLVGAVMWAITGERPRDHSDASPEKRSDVYDKDDRKIGTWPPIACYPTSSSGLTANPNVRVTLTFVDGTGATAVLERRLKNDLVTTTLDPTLSLPDVLVETGILMPSRMPHIRFERGKTHLTRAVQALTGLDNLVDVGALAEGLCHKGREYLSTNARLFEQHKEQFDSALAEAERAFRPTGQPFGTFQPKDTEERDGALTALGKFLRERATELTLVISEDLAVGLDLSQGQTQTEVAGAISGAQEALSGTLLELPTWKSLSAVALALNPKQLRRLKALPAKQRRRSPRLSN